VQLLNPTDANNFLKRAFAAAVARSSIPSRPLAMMTGLSRGLVDGERWHQASGAATSCSLSKPSRAQRSDRYSDLMVLALWKLLHSRRCSKPDNLSQRSVVVMRPGGDGSDECLEKHPCRELDGPGTKSHLFKLIKDGEDWKEILRLEFLHNQALLDANPRRTTFSDVNQNPFKPLKLAMCKYVGGEDVPVCMFVCLCAGMYVRLWCRSVCV
jgi:hypothetical protein